MNKEHLGEVVEITFKAGAGMDKSGRANIRLIEDAAPSTTNYILLEDGGIFLTESFDRLIQE